MKIDDKILNSPDNKNGPIRKEIGNITIKNTNYKYIYTNFKIKRKKIEKYKTRIQKGEIICKIKCKIEYKIMVGKKKDNKIANNEEEANAFKIKLCRLIAKACHKE